MSTTTTTDHAALDLGVDATVPRRLVHKVAIEQVFVTDAAEHDGAYVFAAQLPRSNRLFNDTLVPYHDVTLVAETVRQSAEVMAHRFLDIPLTHHFVIQNMGVGYSDVEANRVAAGSQSMVVRIALDNHRRRRDGSLLSVDGDVTCHIEGARSDWFTGRVLFLPPRTYAALRDRDDPPRYRRPPAVDPAAPESVGRGDGRNVVLGDLELSDGGRGSAVMIVDPGHPVFFDHPADHFPGMALLEAARQMAIACTGSACDAAPRDVLVVSCRSDFRQFAEFDSPLVCTGVARAASAGKATISVEMRQRGELANAFELEAQTT